jgi:hypothetical protein
MEGSRHQIYSNGGITLSALDRIETMLSLEEKEEMDKKIKQFVSIFKFGDFESRSAAEAAFKFGYLAVYVSID